MPQKHFATRREITITKDTRESDGWVKGLIKGLHFEAKMCEIVGRMPGTYLNKTSQITKLYLYKKIENSSDFEVVFHWDRGRDIPATSKEAKGAVLILTSSLAKLLYGEASKEEDVTLHGVGSVS
jgi:hypothetical protein